MDNCPELKLWMFKILFGAQALDTEKLPILGLNVWIKVGSLSSECVDNIPELKLWMFKIMFGAQALDIEKLFGWELEL